MEIKIKDILKAVPELGLLELYTIESRIKKEFKKRNTSKEDHKDERGLKKR